MFHGNLLSNTVLHFQAGFLCFPVLLCSSDRAMFLGTEPRASHILHIHVFYHPATCPSLGVRVLPSLHISLFEICPLAFPWFIHGVKTVNSHRFLFFHPTSFLSFSTPVHVAVTWLFPGWLWILRWASCNRNEQNFFPCWSLRFLLWFFFSGHTHRLLSCWDFFLFSWLYQSCLSILWTM